MTIQEAINQVDNLKPNMYGVKDKIKWLSRLDRRIYEQIILTHEYNEDEEEVTFTSYTPETDPETELLVGEPYDEVYTRWLEAQIDYHDMEGDAFNNSNSVFESVFSAFRNAYNQSHMPRGTKKIYY